MRKKLTTFALVKLHRLLYMVIVATVGLVLYSCANIGSPEGGPIDFTPPHYVKSSPAQGAINVKGNKVEITFDEIVVIKDQQKKVSVSPVQKEPPIIKANGKKVTIEFRDEMKPNTTYSIDFSNAIEDNNEGNPLDGFSFAFSTGDEVDSLQISGILLRARDLEPMQHVTVGLHSNLDDTAFTNLPFERMCRTNDRGQFTLRNLKPGRYHVFALNDMDGNYRMARTEDIAFLDEVIVPSTSTYESMDTVFTFDHQVDTIKAATHTLFMPNDVLLNMFNEDYHAFYLKSTTRPTPSKLHVLFSTHNPNGLPKMEVLKPTTHTDDWCVVEHNEYNDSLFYWITDSTLIKSDSIVVAMDYLRPDSADNWVQHTDTITFAYRKSGTQLKQEAQAKKEREALAKRVASLREKQAKGKELDEEELKILADADKPVIQMLEIGMPKRGTFEIFDTLKFTFPTPIASIKHEGFHLEVMTPDSIWHEKTNLPALVPERTGDVLNYMLPMKFEPDSSYRLRIDSLAITSVYGIQSEPLFSDFKIKGYEEYGNLVVNVNVKDSAFVELLNAQDNIVRVEQVKGSTAVFENLLPNTYYLRLVLDANGNGKWDTGNYLNHIQPEEVYYYPKRLKLRKNWDMEETWDIYATALDKQKPIEIVKNRPEQSKKFDNTDKKKKKKNRNGVDDEDEEDEFGSNGFGRNTYSGDKYRDYQNNNRRR